MHHKLHITDWNKLSLILSNTIHLLLKNNKTAANNTLTFYYKYIYRNIIYMLDLFRDFKK